MGCSWRYCHTRSSNGRGGASPWHFAEKRWTTPRPQPCIYILTSTSKLCLWQENPLRILGLFHQQGQALEIWYSYAFLHYITNITISSLFFAEVKKDVKLKFSPFKIAQQKSATKPLLAIYSLEYDWMFGHRVFSFRKLGSFTRQCHCKMNLCGISWLLTSNRRICICVMECLLHF